MITDHAVLQPDVQPDREVVVHRDGEISHLTSVLEPLTHGYSTTGAFIHGPSGAGKTCTTRCVLEDLERVAGIPVAFLDCLSIHSRRDVLNHVLAELGDGSTLERRSVGPADMAVRIREIVDEPTVVVLDEADQIDELRVLQELYEVPDLTPILIANQPWRKFDRADIRLDSRIGSFPSIEFDAYDESELVEILRERASIGLEPGAVEAGVLEYISECAERNDCRRAISLLFESVKRARRDGEESVTRAVVDASRTDADRQVIRSRLSSLSRQQRIGLEAIGEVGPATSTPLHECYEKRSDDPVGKQAFRKWLPKFAEYELIEKHEKKVAPEYEIREIVLEELGAQVA
ncbi:Cdc6/Cdc18 family protein [Natronosalvus halobius]|uniref:Cdc6/Cdc18 family protein n=1 Tax=Natronosalvus halobius TaxID=2953746 RepID=UPI0020A2330A|nr:AAA family ATPase [Natronosalvus halobius]USZ73736.1 AAA family ATPase [Natronosalvus halobius]